MDDLTITVNIADRPYRLKIKRDEEEVIRKSVKEIEQRLKDYSEQFAFQDKQDLLAMVLLHFSSTCLKLESEQVDGENQVLDRLKQIDRIITDSLV